jgi:hypothetical protein
VGRRDKVIEKSEKKEDKIVEILYLKGEKEIKLFS